MSCPSRGDYKGIMAGLECHGMPICFNPGVKIPIDLVGCKLSRSGNFEIRKSLVLILIYPNAGKRQYVGVSIPETINVKDQ